MDIVKAAGHAASDPFKKAEMVNAALDLSLIHIFPYRWIVRQVGYTIAMMFLKSYEQGERVHKSMISRGFSDTSDVYKRQSLNMHMKEVLKQ